MRPFDELPPAARAEVEKFGRHLKEKGVPRRLDRSRWTPGEHAIQNAVDAIEAMGTDPRLTDAVVLLQEAKRRVAHFVDGTHPAALTSHEREG